MSASADAPVWNSIGHDIIQFFVAVIVETFVIAVYSILVFKTTRINLTRAHHTKVSVFTCTVIIIMFCLALSLWMIDIHNVILEVQMTLLSNSAAPMSDIYASAIRQVLRLAAVEDVLYAYMTILGDILIIWRVYAFWSRGRGRVVLIVPLAFLLGSISTALTLSYCAARLGADIKLGTYQHPQVCRNIQTASYSMTLATTAVATALIAYKFWDYQREDDELFRRMTRSSWRQKLMLVLIESGMVYMLFFLVQVIVSLATVNASINKSAALVFASTVYSFNTSLLVARTFPSPCPYYVVRTLTYHFATQGIYPTAVVLLVHSRYMKQGSGPVDSTKGLKTSRTRTQTQASLIGNAAAHVKPARMKPGQSTEVDLYEMASMSDNGLTGVMEGVKDEGKLVVDVHHAIEQRVM
ncbi:hypothetical protein FKP32DRAFT_1016645 [Trametes sanguinea]|nr:hypothetical protein FKP32DRAFT_1016645 [Trametes sanguinea]